MAYSYKCPNCSANLVFDADIRRMACGFCESVISPHDIVSKENDQEGYVMGEQWTDATLYNCGNCNAEVVVGEDALTDTCVYCESPVILTHRLSAGVKPTKIIPFRFDKKQAQDECMKLIKKKKLLPGKFLRQMRMRDLKGIYIPVWLIDYPVDINVEYYEIYDNEMRKAEGLLLWERVPVDASSNIKQDLMARIEPYNYDYLQSFETQYLSGYLAEKPNMSHEKLGIAGYFRVKEFADVVLRASLNRDEFHYKDESMYKKGNAELTLMPVWFMKIAHRNRIYTIVANGQTGAVSADLPMSKLRIACLGILLWLIFMIPSILLLLFMTSLEGLF